jgi:hypothetical protein
MVPTNQPPESKHTIDELLADLRSDNMATSGAAERELHIRLNTLSDGLLEIVSATHVVDKNRAMQRKPVDRALLLLGRLDRRRIVRALLMNICYSDHSAVTKASFPPGHPFATMLCGLGTTAAYEITNYLERPPVSADLSDRAIESFARVIQSVFSHQNGGAEEAKAMLTRAHHRAKNKHHSERLQKRFREIIAAPIPAPPPNAEST